MGCLSNVLALVHQADCRDHVCRIFLLRAWPWFIDDLSKDVYFALDVFRHDHRDVVLEDHVAEVWRISILDHNGLIEVKGKTERRRIVLWVFLCVDLVTNDFKIAAWNE